MTCMLSVQLHGGLREILYRLLYTTRDDTGLVVVLFLKIDLDFLCVCVCVCVTIVQASNLLYEFTLEKDFFTVISCSAICIGKS